INGLLSTNMFSYCENNPVNRSDPSGQWWVKHAVALTSAIVGFVAGAATQIADNLARKKMGYDVNWGDGALAAGLGAATYNAVSVYTRGNSVAAGYASAFVESTVSEVECYVKGTKSLSSQSFKDSAKRIAKDTAVKGTAYAAAGKIADRLIPLDVPAMVNHGMTTGEFKQTIFQSLGQSAAYLFGKYGILASLS
ncbi:MAG: hypothetical protein HUJ66_01950, partial [Oscillospiraceae bacterium]|nr:hypothetical protein [Oscillospiraceae bacterium]